jgi:hypothetical protein
MIPKCSDDFDCFRKFIVHNQTGQVVVLSNIVDNYADFIQQRDYLHSELVQEKRIWLMSNLVNGVYFIESMQIRIASVVFDKGMIAFKIIEFWWQSLEKRVVKIIDFHQMYWAYIGKNENFKMLDAGIE